MINYRPKVYLAGKMTGLTQEQMTGWRIKAKTLLIEAGFDVIDPTDNVDSTNIPMGPTGIDMSSYEAKPNEIIDVNIHHMRRADIILAEFNNEYRSLGTFGEIIVAYRELHKPVVCWGGDYMTLNHAWLRGNCTTIREELAEAIQFIIDVFRG